MSRNLEFQNWSRVKTHKVVGWSCVGLKTFTSQGCQRELQIQKQNKKKTKIQTKTKSLTSVKDHICTVYWGEGRYIHSLVWEYMDSSHWHQDHLPQSLHFFFFFFEIFFLHWTWRLLFLTTVAGHGASEQSTCFCVPRARLQKSWTQVFKHFTMSLGLKRFSYTFFMSVATYTRF